MARTILFVLILFLASIVSAQKLDTLRLRALEDTLHMQATIAANDTIEARRVKANYAMIPTLVTALKIDNSYQYRFDSLEYVSVQYAPDNSFRIFTWFLRGDNGAYRYFGTLQKNKAKLEMFPLFDYTDSLERPADTVLTNESWYGALYYNIKQVKAKDKTYYLLFGWDGNDLLSSKKLIDVLYFENGKPKFGAPIFDIANANGKKPMRFIMEYKRNSSVTLNYDEERKMIVFSHLTPSSEKTADLKFTFIADGSYDGFEWKNGKLQFVDNVYKDVVDSRKDVPVPLPKGSDKMKPK
ncbi:MAG: hypothetical protein SFW35_02885 [Chitinophagales bacterium]|nr:hypothetical protein [Chitinophagales bacterium]